MKEKKVLTRFELEDKVRLAEIEVDDLEAELRFAQNRLEELEEELEEGGSISARCPRCEMGQEFYGEAEDAHLCCPRCGYCGLEAEGHDCGARGSA